MLGSLRQQPMATLPLVSPPNDVWEASAEIPYWWRGTTHIWVVLLIGRVAWKFDSTNQKHYPDLDTDASSVWNFCVRFSDVFWRGNQWYRRQMTAGFSGKMLGNPRHSWILDSTLWILDSSYWIPDSCQWNLDSGFLELYSWFQRPGFQI